MKRVELCCGAVLYAEEGGRRVYALVVRDEDGAVGFPKGHLEAGETEREAAKREILEETGVCASIVEGFRETYGYALPNGNGKRVIVFLARGGGEAPRRVEGEPNGVLCLPYPEALDALSHDDPKRILAKAERFLVSLDEMAGAR